MLKVRQILSLPNREIPEEHLQILRNPWILSGLEDSLVEGLEKSCSLGRHTLFCLRSLVI